MQDYDTHATERHGDDDDDVIYNTCSALQLAVLPLVASAEDRCFGKGPGPAEHPTRIGTAQVDGCPLISLSRGR